MHAQVGDFISENVLPATVLLSHVSIDLIQHNELCPSRMSEIDGLAESLSKEGQLSPIRIRKHPAIKRSFLVVFGNRRLAAARKLGWKTIRAEVIWKEEGFAQHIKL